MKLLLAVFLSIFVAMPTPPTFDIQGHRGSRGLLPENTIPAFLRAIDEGVTTLELDVVISKDKKVVVSHEPYFNPMISTLPNGEPVTAATRGNIYQLPYKEIKKYDVGLRGNPGFPEQQKIAVYKPLLSDVIKAVKKYTKQKGLPMQRFNIEIKSYPIAYGTHQPPIEEFSDLVMKEIKKHVSPDLVTVQSFDFSVLKHCHKQIKAGKYPPVELSVLLEMQEDNDVESVLNKLGFVPPIWSPNYTQVTPERIAALHARNIRVIPWTVNQVADMKRLKAMGCDGLITDYPDRAKGL